MNTHPEVFIVFNLIFKQTCERMTLVPFLLLVWGSCLPLLQYSHPHAVLTSVTGHCLTHSSIWLNKLVGQIYCTLSLRKTLTICSNVTISNK